jgi:hypothetical protein
LSKNASTGGGSFGYRNLHNTSFHRTRKSGAPVNSALGITMLRVTFLVAFFFATTASHADDSVCSKLADRIDGTEGNYRPPLEAAVVGAGRLNFYSAPNALCRMKGVFVVKGDVLTVYKSYEGWANVMFIAKKGGDFMGWVPENRVKINGQYGQNP